MRMEENGRHIKMVKTQAILYQKVREPYHALRACPVWSCRKSFVFLFASTSCLPHIPSAPVRCLKGSRERRSSTVDCVVFCKLHSKLPQVQTWGTQCSRSCLEAPEGSNQKTGNYFQCQRSIGNLWTLIVTLKFHGVGDLMQWCSFGPWWSLWSFLGVGC